MPMISMKANAPALKTSCPSVLLARLGGKGGGRFGGDGAAGGVGGRPPSMPAPVQYMPPSRLRGEQ